MKPALEDIRILFEGKSSEFIKLYKQDIDDLIDYDDYKELEELEEPEKRISIFELLFAMPVAKDDNDEEVVIAMAEEYLPYEVDADYADNGLMITANGKEHFIILKNSYEDRYHTLRKLNEIIYPKYEIRVMDISLDDDIHSFLILEKEEWKAMEEKYGEKARHYFRTIDDIDFL